MKPATELSDVPATLLMGASSLGTSAALPVDIDDAGDAIAAPRVRARGKLADLLDLTKPRMNLLVVATTMVGYYMAARDWSDHWLLVATIGGTALTAAGASVLNQYIERRHDAKMNRTAGRALAAGRLPAVAGLAIGVLLSVVGLLVLSLWVNGLTAMLGMITLGSYVFVYTPLKRVTTLCTVVGAVPGAIPPMMGVTAVTGDITPAALLLFGILFLWQMPHFLAIAILYRDDYARGGFKMLPVVDGDDGIATARQMVVYSMALIPASLLPTIFHVTGVVYFAAALLMGMAFLGFAVLCALARRRAEARQLFFVSIIYLPFLLGAMMIDKV